MTLGLELLQTFRIPIPPTTIPSTYYYPVDDHPVHGYYAIPSETAGPEANLKFESLRLSHL